MVNPTPVRALGVPMLVALVMACAGEPEAAPGAPAEPGVVENPAPPEESRLPWTIGPEPVLSIGTQAGDDAYQLFRVRDAAVLPDGRVAVANGGTGEIRVFDADGSHVVSMGGLGEGPGEYRALNDVVPWAGDSIMGWDVRQQRVSVFDGDGSHGRTFRVRDFEDTFTPEFLGMTPDGRMLMRAGFPQRDGTPHNGMFRADHSYGLVDGEGRLDAELGRHPGEEGFLFAAGGFESFFGHPHGRSTLAAVWGERVLISPNDTYELRAFDFQGRPVMRVRMDQAPRVPTRDDMEAWFDAFTANDTPEERADFRETFEAFPLLDGMPAFETILVDDLECVWVRDFRQTGEEEPKWVVFDAEGRVQGRLETPVGLEIYEIGADYILGRSRDSFGVEYVERWVLTRS